MPSPYGRGLNSSRFSKVTPIGQPNVLISDCLTALSSSIWDLETKHAGPTRSSIEPLRLSFARPPRARPSSCSNHSLERDLSSNDRVPTELVGILRLTGVTEKGFGPSEGFEMAGAPCMSLASFINLSS